jgi:hypothetical protein
MKLYLSGRTTGQSGGFAKNLPYFNNYIDEYLTSAGFDSSFEELWVTFAYPPTYIWGGIIGMEIKYKEWYDTFAFPYSRLNRRYKTIDVLLKTPEFSESFESIPIEQEPIHSDAESLELFKKKKEIIRLDIEPQYKGIPREEVAKIMVDKLIYAGEVINAKLKKGDDFDFKKYKSILTQLKEGITTELLDKIAIEQKEKLRANDLKKALIHREIRRNASNVKDKLIRDIRVYYKESYIPLKGLYPYEYQYVDIFINTLQKHNFLCPTYHHLYIQVAQTEEEALLGALPQIEDWYVYGISTLDYTHYCEANEKDKEALIFDMIYRGLLDIVEIDKLDRNVFQKAVDEIKIKGLDTELVVKSVENQKYKLEVTYFSRSREEESPIYFTLTDKATNKSSKKEIGRAKNEQIFYWLQKITLTKKSIKVQAGNSPMANAWLKDKTRVFEIDYADFEFL